MAGAQPSAQVIEHATKAQESAREAKVKPELGRIEEWILRRAFDDEENTYLPKIKPELGRIGEPLMMRKTCTCPRSDSSITFSFIHIVSYRESKATIFSVRCLAVSPNFEIAMNMAIALTDLCTKN